VTRLAVRRCAAIVVGLICTVGFEAGGDGQGQMATLSPWLETALRQGAPGARHRIWVYFRDKGQPLAGRSMPLSERALGRRARRAGNAAWRAYDDQSVAGSYARQVAAQVSRVRHTLRWLNAMSVEASPEQVRALAALPFVERLDVVRRARGTPETPVEVRSASTTDAGRPRPFAGPLD